MAAVLLQVLRSFGAGDPGNTGGPAKSLDPKRSIDPKNAGDPWKTLDPTRSGDPKSAVDPKIWDSSDLGGCLLLGGKSCAKTSLLFHVAAAAAGQEGRRVLFLAPSPIQSLPAALLNLEPRSLRRVQFVYPRSAQELLQTVASLHENLDKLPSLILLDGMDEFLQGHSRQDLGRQAALLAALLRDTAAWISECLAPNTVCQVIVTLQTLTEKESTVDLGLQLIERYFPVKCMVREQQCNVEGAQSYLVSFSGLMKTETRETCVPQIEEYCTWELLYEADNISRIHRVTREERGNEEVQGTWDLQERTSN